MKPEKLEQVQSLKSECNRAKSELMRISSALENVSRKHALQLDRIIARLEKWQNSR
mgnify:CR=1 FL=1